MAQDMTSQTDRTSEGAENTENIENKMQHIVTVSDFCLSIYELIQAEYREIMGRIHSIMGIMYGTDAMMGRHYQYIISAAAVCQVMWKNG